MKKSLLITTSLISILIIMSICILHYTNSKVRPHMKNSAHMYCETLNNLLISDTTDKSFEDKLNRFITNYERVALTKKERLILDELTNLHANYIMCAFYKKENDITNLNKTINSFKANGKKLKEFLGN